MYLFGAGGHCKAIIDMIVSDLDEDITGIFDDNHTETIMGYEVTAVDTSKFKAEDNFHICIGDNITRKKVSQSLVVNYPTLIHPSSLVSKFSTVDKGSVVMGNVSVKAVSKIGKHCILNAGAVIGHDVTIEDYVHIAPNASIAGYVTVKEGVHFGIGASVIQGITIGKWAIIGAGAVIIEDVPDFAVVVGNPGRIIKYTMEHKNTTP
ncbi:acetyltransferase [Spongiimicrobium salis]|uniref:acetyltransferase n=1 Tax=Spongiimicrobium salis TaxID=1667022 RepID=UPI00374CAA58